MKKATATQTTEEITAILDRARRTGHRVEVSFRKRTDIGGLKAALTSGKVARFRVGKVPGTKDAFVALLHPRSKVGRPIDISNISTAAQL